MAVDLAALRAIERNELVTEVFARFLPRGGIPAKVGKAVFGDRGDGDFGFEEIHFVEEEDEGRVLEPVRVGDGFPEHEGFLHLVLEALD